MLKWILRLLAFGLSLGGIFAFWRWWSIRHNRQAAPKPTSLLRDPDIDFSLYREGDKLYARWERQGQAKLYLGTSPENIQRDKAAAIIEAAQTIAIDNFEANQRYWAEIVFDDGRRFNTVERIFPFKTVANFRDIGGYATKTGYQVAWNRVFRSAALDNISAEDFAALEALGLRLVCDLRTSEEHLANPDKLPPTIPLINLAPISKDNALRQLGRILFQVGFLEGLLLDLYTRVMLDENPKIFAALFRKLADKENLPMLIHCAAGKDRTGIAIALLLKLLGVDEETILADYALSNRSYDFFRASTIKSIGQLRFLGLSDSDFDYLLIADVEIMRKTFAYLHEKYGSVEAYLTMYVGLSNAELEAIRQNLLE